MAAGVSATETAAPDAPANLPQHEVKTIDEAASTEPVGTSASEAATPDAQANLPQQDIETADEARSTEPAADSLADPAAANTIETAAVKADGSSVSPSGAAVERKLESANEQPDASLPAETTETTAVSEEEKVAACERQLQQKISHVKQLFSGFQLPEVEVFRSAPEHYRLRWALPRCLNCAPISERPFKGHSK